MDEKVLDDLVDKAAKKVEVVEGNSKIDPDQLSDGLNDHFACMICMMVVDKPLECSNCQKLFCSDCIAAQL
jgi:hypothetical protein